MALVNQTTGSPRVFFTYVWGAPGEPAWPLTFATKASRAHAKAVLAEGDLVFTVGTKGEPTHLDHRGRVVGIYQVSDLEVNTQDYGLLSKHDAPEFDSSLRFPFALHPISVSKIVDDNNIFSKLVGPLTPVDHLQAQSRLVELPLDKATELLTLAKMEITAALPNTAFGRGRIVQKNSKLAPKHEGSFIGQFKDHEIWYIYTLVLRDQKNHVLAVKVGYAHSPEKRQESYNNAIASEVTGLQWYLSLKQPTDTENSARTVEQLVLAKFSRAKLASNGEILRGVDHREIETAIAIELRALAV